MFWIHIALLILARIIQVKYKHILICIANCKGCIERVPKLIMVYFYNQNDIQIEQLKHFLLENSYL